MGLFQIAIKYPNLRLKIVGKGSLENKLKQKANDFQFQIKLILKVFKKYNSILHKCKATVSLLFEGYPNTLIESIALGTQLLHLIVKWPKIIKNNINGYLVKHLDTNDLTEKIVKLLNTNFNRKKISETVKKNHTEYILKQYEELIKKIMND